MSLIDYHKSTTRELVALTHKVRNLVPNWGEDGKYKEVVLKNIIKRFLPEKFSIGTGFVIKQTENRGEHLSSTQIDLIIFSNDAPVLFREGDFVILTADAVKGIIEVKANVQNQNLQEIVRKANENGSFIFSGKKNKEENFFNGIFSYESRFKNDNIHLIERHVIEGNAPFIGRDNFENYKVNHISFDQRYFLKYWPEEERPHSVYCIPELSFSFFISNLIDTLSSESVEKNNFIWFANDKELHLERNF
jgi:hypothetical protein